VSQQALANSAGEPDCRCEAHHVMAATLMSLGQLEASRPHFDAALAAYDETHPQRSALGSDLGVFVLAWYAHSAWLLGDEPAALAHSDRAIALALSRDHAYTQTLAYAYAALLHQMRRDMPRVLETARAAVELCERHGFAYYGDWARVLLGWIDAQTNPAEGIALIESALQRLDRTRAQARRPYYLSLLAEAYEAADERQRAAEIVDMAIGMAVERRDEWWLPALFLQRSRLILPAERDAALERALDLARRQRSRSLERRILDASPARAAAG
jgi:hypothetical protein